MEWKQVDKGLILEVVITTARTEPINHSLLQTNKILLLEKMYLHAMKYMDLYSKNPNIGY